jgi:cytochrome b561
MARYTKTAMLLHWLVAVLILGNIVLILLADSFGEAAGRSIVNTHKSIGLTVLGLVLLRILWRASHPAPDMPRRYPKRERILAQVTHAALYVLMLAIPVSGYLHDSAWKGAAKHPLLWFGLFDVPRLPALQHMAPGPQDALHRQFGLLHYSLAWILLGLFVLHVAGALKHQFLDHEAELQRMLPGD